MATQTFSTSAEYIAAIADIDKQLSVAKGQLSAAQTRYQGWWTLCYGPNKQQCDTTAFNTTDAAKSDMDKLQAQVDSLTATRAIYVTQAGVLQKQEADAAAAAVEQAKATAKSTTPATIAQQIKDTTLSKNVKTIGVVVVIIAIIVVGYFVWKKYKGA